MKTYLDCIPCMIRQALDTTRFSTDDEILKREVLEHVMLLLINFVQNDSSDEYPTPPQIGRHIYRIIKEITKCEDPYREIKIKYNRMALNKYSELKSIIENSSDSLLTAIKVAVAGNIIDFGINSGEFDLDSVLKDVLNKSFGICDYDLFQSSLEKAKKILYIGDNAGEIVFDKLLIEEILKRYNLKIYFAVRGKPIINDVTIEDAKQVRMDAVAEIVDSGCDAPGIILELCSKEFLKIYNEAELIISKGQGNYETLDEEDKKNIFFLFRAKCKIVAKHLKVKVNDIILKGGKKEGTC